MPAIGQQIATALLSWHEDQSNLQTLAPIALSILLGELRNSSQREHTEAMVVTYLALHRKLGGSGELHGALLVLIRLSLRMEQLART